MMISRLLAVVVEEDEDEQQKTTKKRKKATVVATGGRRSPLLHKFPPDGTAVPGPSASWYLFQFQKREEELERQMMDSETFKKTKYKITTDQKNSKKVIIITSSGA